MTMKTAQAVEAFMPDANAETLIIQPLEDESVATQVTTLARQADHTHDYRIPVVTADPTAAWTAEGEEITTSTASLAEEIVTPRKLAGLTVVTRELAEDTSPGAQEVVGQGLVRDIARKLDAAFFGSNTEAKDVQPRGLEDVEGVTTVTGAFTNTDVFSEALSKAEAHGATITAWVTDPDTALTLAKVKKQTGSNEPLLGLNATAPTRRTILGVPMFVTPAVTKGTVWAIPRDRVYTVIHSEAQLTADESVYFTSDRIAVRATTRVGFGFPHAAAIIKVTAA